jgi:hypothetical protein
LNNVKREDNHTQTEREADYRNIEPTDSAEIDECQGRRRDDHRENNEACFEVSELRRHFQPKQQLFGDGGVADATGTD